MLGRARPPQRKVNITDIGSLYMILIRHRNILIQQGEKEHKKLYYIEVNDRYKFDMGENN